MTPAERIEEAHGLWELAVSRVAGMTELLFSGTGGAGVGGQIELGQPAVVVIREAVYEEREAFNHWQEVSNAITLVKP